MVVESSSEITPPELIVEGVAFSSVASPPGSSVSLFLAGAGARGMEVGGGKYVNFTAIGVYLDKAAATAALAGKWKGKSADGLVASSDFYREICAGSFEKLTRVTMLVPLTGQQYSEKVAENCVESWKATGIFSDALASDIEKFLEVFRPENFPPASSIFFSHSVSGDLEIGFSKDGGVSVQVAVIRSRALSEAVLESIIGERGVSPEAKQSVAERLSVVLAEA